MNYLKSHKVIDYNYYLNLSNQLLLSDAATIDRSSLSELLDEHGYARPNRLLNQHDTVQMEKRPTC